MTKLCPKCLKEQPTEDFKRKSCWCIGCVRTFVVSRMVRKEAAVEYLGGKCMNPNCPLPKDYELHPDCFDFHHRDPKEKEFRFSARGGRSWPRVLNELDKCDLLCCICHRLLHAHTKDSITARCREIGIDYKTYKTRLAKGLTIEQILTPKQPGKRFTPIELLEIGGVSKTAVEWCVELGTNYRTYHTRVSRGRDKIEALTESPSRPKTLTINGETKTIKQWCKHFDIAETNYYRRIALAGMSPEAALTTPKRPGKQLLRIQKHRQDSPAGVSNTES